MWSFSPVSGEGASKTGGRFNRPSEPTLYLSFNITTAVNEITQGLTRRLHPLTICEYDVDCESVADLSTLEGQSAHAVSFDDLACPWMSFIGSGRVPPSWLVVDRLKKSGFVGMIAPSFAVGAHTGDNNLILWTWGLELPTQVRVYDPSGRLPRDQRSWLTD